VSMCLELLGYKVCVDSVLEENIVSMSEGRSQWARGPRRRSTGLSPAAIVGSNPTGGMDVCLL
jgi:hypothetical protein